MPNYVALGLGYVRHERNKLTMRIADEASVLDDAVENDEKIQFFNQYSDLDCPQNLISCFLSQGLLA